MIADKFMKCVVLTLRIGIGSSRIPVSTAGSKVVDIHDACLVVHFVRFAESSKAVETVRRIVTVNIAVVEIGSELITFGI